MERGKKMRLLDREALKAEKGIKYGPVHLWRLWNAGKFPKPLKIGMGQGSRNCWSEDEIDAWIAGRIAARDAKMIEPRPGEGQGSDDGFPNQ